MCEREGCGRDSSRSGARKMYVLDGVVDGWIKAKQKYRWMKKNSKG